MDLTDGLKPAFVEYLRSEPELEFLTESLLTAPEVSVRINPAKGLALPPGEPVPWCKEGVYLPERPKFTFDPALHQGRYYVQDASSMAIAVVVRQLTASATHVRYLDACAAPGGKTTAALAALPDGSVVVANEFDYRRAEILTENLAKWGAPGVIVTRGDTARFSVCDSVFDIVSVDAPCSGEGMMRKDAKARSQWSSALVRECAALQRQIIDNVWPALRPGGYMIYSTCTFNRTEDEENLQYIIDRYGAEAVRIEVLDGIDGIVRGIRTSAPCYRFLPGKIKGEGLFIAAVRKPGEAPAAQLKIPKKGLRDYRRVSDMGLLDGDFVYFQRQQDIYAFPASLADGMLVLSDRLGAIASGVGVCSVKGKDFIPSQALAMSQALRRGAYPEAEVPEEEALAYLRREVVTLPDSAPKGYVLLTCGGCSLGFVKNLGNRANNLYPQAWRILTK